MRINSSHPDFDHIVCLFNGRRCVSAVEADDTEGWVEIIDPKAMVTLNGCQESQAEIDPTTGEFIEEWSEIPTKKLYGKVEFIRISK